MDCELGREFLESYAAGRLSAGEAARFEGHLSGCPACAGQLRWVRALKGAVRGQPRPALPAPLRAALLRQARQAARVSSGEGWLASVRLSWRFLAGVGCASAFAAAAALFMLGRSGAASDELSLDEVLEAHSRYELTMPAASRDALYVALGRAEAAHD